MKSFIGDLDFKRFIKTFDMESYLKVLGITFLYIFTVFVYAGILLFVEMGVAFLVFYATDNLHQTISFEVFRTLCSANVFIVLLIDLARAIRGLIDRVSNHSSTNQSSSNDYNIYHNQ